MSFIIHMKQFRFFSFIIISVLLNGCTALFQAQTSIQKATGQLPPRAYVIDYPPNGDRIKPTLIPGGGMLTTNPNPWGVRYKDYVFTDFDILTETYKKTLHKSGNLIMDIFTPRSDAEKKRPCIVYVLAEVSI